MKGLVLVLLVAALLPAGPRRLASGYADCEDDDIYGLQGHCGEAVWVRSPAAAAAKPTDDCCHFVTERTSLACVCRYIVTPRQERYISMKKLAHIAEYCGVPLKPGTKCGSYLIPTRS